MESAIHSELNRGLGRAQVDKKDQTKRTGIPVNAEFIPANPLLIHMGYAATQRKAPKLPVRLRSIVRMTLSTLITDLVQGCPGEKHRRRATYIYIGIHLPMLWARA